jgi:hypothetical protein
VTIDPAAAPPTDTPASWLRSVDVDVRATFSFSLGLVSVLFVNVCVAASTATVSGPVGRVRVVAAAVVNVRLWPVVSVPASPDK